MGKQRGIRGMFDQARQTWESVARKFPFRVQCNACGWRGRTLASDSWHPYTKCPRCRSRVRHRLLCAALEYLDRFKATALVHGKRVLHFAPEPQVSCWLRNRAAQYVTSDPAMEGVDLRLDLCRMADVPDGAYDLTVACDVLEHVADDSTALREIHRILAPLGWAILTVPQQDGLAAKYEDPALTTPEARTQAFGQRDHLRIYGDDFVYFVEAHGFTVAAVDEHSFDPALARRLVLYPPIPSIRPLATNHRKVFFARRR
jgi:SAM-dependent methyltransferase